ncbi:sugar phosphate isomerase/epimerase family protein [Thermodesulfobacteriota bacterium]
MDEAVKELYCIGFRNIELTGGTNYRAGIEADLLRLQKDLGLKFAVHNYFPPPKEEFVLNPASSDPQIHRKTLSLITKAIEFAEAADSSLYSIHAGYTTNFYPEKEGLYFKRKEDDQINADYKELFLSTLEKILVHTSGSEVRLAVENMFPLTAENSYSFLWRPDEIEEFLKLALDEPRLGLLIDLGHLNIAARHLKFDPIDFCCSLFKRYSKKIFAIHLSHNDGLKDQHGVNLLNSWQIETLSLHRLLVSELPITFEWHGMAGQKELFKNFERICEILNG